MSTSSRSDVDYSQSMNVKTAIQQQQQKDSQDNSDSFSKCVISFILFLLSKLKFAYIRCVPVRRRNEEEENDEE